MSVQGFKYTLKYSNYRYTYSISALIVHKLSTILVHDLNAPMLYMQFVNYEPRFTISHDYPIKMKLKALSARLLKHRPSKPIVLRSTRMQPNYVIRESNKRRKYMRCDGARSKRRFTEQLDPFIFEVVS